MKKTKSSSLLITMSIILTLGLFGYSVQNWIAFTNAQESDTQYSTVLSGDEEVPPVDTQAVGIADFAPSENSVGYTINATEIEGTTAGHVHFGIEGENGPIIVTLFKYDTPQNQVSESGTITAENLTGPLQGMQVSDLIDEFNEGNTYVNIHSEKNPNSEIRGQAVDLKLQIDIEEQ
jgi:hypothetical protein